MVRVGLLAALLCVAAAPSTRAHDGIHARLLRADERVADAPTDAAARLERARLRLEHGELPEARDDLVQADRLRGAEHLPGLLDTQVALAEALGLPRVADELLAARLARAPDDGEAWGLAGDTLARRGQARAASRAYRRALHDGARCTPDLLARAVEAARNAGRADDALGLVDLGVARLGAVPALMLAGVELERVRERPDAALARLSALRRLAPDHEEWLALEGDLRLEAGQSAAAHEAWSRARTLLRARPLRRRASPSGLDLEARLTALLAAPVVTSDALPAPSAVGARPSAARAAAPVLTPSRVATARVAPAPPEGGSP